MHNRLRFLDTVLTRIVVDGGEVVHIIDGYMASHDKFNVTAYFIDEDTQEQKKVSRYDVPGDHIEEMFPAPSIILP